MSFLDQSLNVFFSNFQTDTSSIEIVSAFFSALVIVSIFLAISRPFNV